MHDRDTGLVTIRTFVKGRGRLPQLVCLGGENYITAATDRSSWLLPAVLAPGRLGVRVEEVVVVRRGRGLVRVLGLHGPSSNTPGGELSSGVGTAEPPVATGGIRATRLMP